VGKVREEEKAEEEVEEVFVTCKNREDGRG
jgi:hypothetical protein